MIHTIVGEIRKINISKWIDGDVPGLFQSYVCGRLPVSRAARPLTPACNGLDGSIGSDPADASVAEIGYIEIPGAIGGQAIGRIQRCVDCRSAVSREPRAPGSRHGGDDAVRGDFANAMVVRIRNVDVSGEIAGDPFDVVNEGCARGAAVANRIRTRDGDEHRTRLCAGSKGQTQYSRKQKIAGIAHANYVGYF